MVCLLNVANSFSRLALCSVIGLRNVSTCTYPLYFRATDVLLGEPMKKRKKLDAGVIRAREERKKKKIEKEIRRVQKFHKTVKTIFELDSSELKEQAKDRLRPVAALSSQELESRVLLEKKWCTYKLNQWARDKYIVTAITVSQENALKELRDVSEELYQNAIKFDDSLVPYDAVGPVHTPPIDNYNSPDGEYIDVTYKYEGET